MYLFLEIHRKINYFLQKFEPNFVILKLIFLIHSLKLIEINRCGAIWDAEGARFLAHLTIFQHLLFRNVRINQTDALERRHREGRDHA